MSLLNVLYYKKYTMEENVVFPPNQDSGQPPVEQDPSTIPADPIADPNVVADPNADPNAPAAEVPAGDGTPPPDDGAAPAEGAPPPSNAGMIKKILIGVGILIVIIFLVVLLIPKKQAAPKEVTLEWWGLWEDTRGVQSTIDQFEKENPTIKVKYVNSTPQQYFGRLKTRIQNGTGPDIFRYHNSWLPMLSDSLLPLSADVMTVDDFKKNYPLAMQQDLIQNGAIYGIPLDADSLAMFANTDLFDKAGIQVPSTWEDFIDTARKLTVKDADSGKIKTAGAGLGTFGNVTHASDIVSMLFLQQGIDIKKITDSSPESEKRKGDALDFYAKFARGDQSVWDSTLDQSVLAFARGNLALYFGYSWDVFRIQQINKSLQFKIYPVPGLQGGKNPTIASYWVEGASSKGKNQHEAYVFLKFLAKKETAEKLYTEQAKTRPFGEPYARKDLADTLKDNQLVYPFVSQLPYASSTYFASDTFDGDDGFNTALNAYLNNAVTAVSNGTQGTNSTVKAFDAGVSQVYLKYGIQ
jgi:multiple sugar transport system substrate-binding protein